MQLDAVISRLALGEGAGALRLAWEASQSAMPDGDLWFLNDTFLREACRDTFLPNEIARPALAASKRLASDPAARALLWHFHHCLFQTGDYPRERILDWPPLDGALGEDGRPAYLVAVLSGLPAMRALHQAHRVPAAVARDTLLDLRLWLETEKTKTPDRPWGLVPMNVWWLANHFRGELYRLGRLQFQFGSFQYRLRVFRHRRSRVVGALSEDGVTYRADGGKAGSQPEPGSWTARLRLGRREIVGSPIAPTGRAVPREVRLRTSDWQEALARGQPVLHVHIPEGPPLAPDLCGDSFRRAMAFFPGHFPNRPFDGFCCGSWLLDAELEDLLPPGSNILRFQREYYLFPIMLGAEGMLERIFGEIPRDLDRAPADTTLRRAVLDRLREGGELRPMGGGGFLLPEDLDWGRQVYRSQQLPW